MFATPMFAAHLLHYIPEVLYVATQILMHDNTKIWHDQCMSAL